MPRLHRRLKKRRQKSRFETAPFEQDLSLEEGPDNRFRNDPLHAEGPGNTFASRRARLASLVMKQDNSLNRVK